MQMNSSSRFAIGAAARMVACVSASVCVWGMTSAHAFQQLPPRDRPAAPPVGAPAATAKGTGVISGRMTVNTANGAAPVRRARVVLESTALTKSVAVDTDTEGRYRFAELPAGTFRIRGEKAGFVARIVDARRAFEPPPPVDLKAGASAVIDLPMQPGGAVEGRILKANGDPAMNITVSAVRMAYDITGRVPVAVQQTKTDDLGRFRVHTLPPGEYRVDAAPDPLAALSQAPTAGPKPPAMSRTYFPGSARLDDARVVAVAVGQTISNLDFTITTVPTALLRGKVMTSDGRPATTSTPRIQRVDGPVGEVRGSSSATGDFSYPSVPAGEFWLMAVARNAAGENEYSAARVTMDGNDVTNQLVTTAKMPAVIGRVEGAAVSASMQVVANEVAYELPRLAADAPLPWSARVSADGSFAFAALPGPRLIRVEGLPAGVALKSVFAGETDVTEAPFEVKAGDAAPALRVVLTAETAKVAGVVKDAAGAVAANARVLVFSENEKQWHGRSRVIYAAETRADGSYEITSVLPGTYHVIAVPFLESMSWMDSTVLHQLVPSAEKKTIQAGSVALPLVVKR